VLSGPVFAELMATPGRTEAFLNRFCSETGLVVEFDLDEDIWQLAGRALQSYASRRRKQREPGPRCILADFLIGAHAHHRGYRLLTLDGHLYHAAFSNLAVITV
jgi:predicted nucleic acid-binding protein